MKKVIKHICDRPQKFMHFMIFAGFILSAAISVSFLKPVSFSNIPACIITIIKLLFIFATVQICLAGPVYVKTVTDSKKAEFTNNVVFYTAVMAIPFVFAFNIQLIQFDNFFYTVEWIMNHTAPFLLGYLLILMLYFALICILRFRMSTALTGFMTFALACINYYKCKFRNEPFLPWDLKSSAELKSIMPQLRIKPTYTIIFCFIVYIALLLYAKHIRDIKHKRFPASVVARSSAFLIILFVCYQFVNLTFYNEKILNKLSMSINNWEQTETYNNNGVVSAFVLNSVNLSIDKPEDYSEQTVKNLCDDIKKSSVSDVKTETNVKNPNIIVIMSEGFWDVTELPGIKFEEELLPTLKMLKTNYSSGHVFSPKFGGGTSNVEFEALTGFANQFLPPNSVPYEQYILKPTFSIAQYLKSKGYSTLAIHSNDREFWNRNTAYKNLYFDNFIASDNFENPELKRGLISDMEVSKKIISEFEKNNAKNDKPWFNYTVTMQNHMAYSSEKWDENDIVKFESGNISDSVENGLKDLATGLNYSDKALKYLVDYFKKTEEPTIIVFFGDHFNLLGDTTEQVFEETGFLENHYTELDKNYSLYRTPIVIWNNYTDIKCDVGNISSFQIMPTVMELFNLDMPLYFEYLNKLKETSRGYSRNVVLDEDGEPSYDLNSKQKELYDKFHLIQYDHMFGNRYSDSLFE